MINQSMELADWKALTQQSLQKIRRLDGQLKAWVFTADDTALLEDEVVDGSLAGVPFGVKDIINVEGMQTRCGSPSYDTSPVQFDAACVSLLRAAGAIPVGKTATAEFAFVSPALTRNPINLEHTPGGSSSGSAAAVAAGMIPFALGTQTGGSVIRPSAFCGTVGFKPTFGAIHRDGMKITCDSLDTIGWHASTVEIATEVGRALLGQPSGKAETQSLDQLKLAYMPTLPSQAPDADALTVLEKVKGIMASSADVREIPPLPIFSDLLEAHHLIMHYELARSLQPVLRRHAPLLSVPLKEAVSIGMAIPSPQYVDMKQKQLEWRHRWSDCFADADLILTPSAIGSAPRGLGSTGSSIFNRIWTLLGWPCLHLPLSRADNGLPLGVQFVGKPNSDMELLQWGQLIDKQLNADVSRKIEV